MWGTMYVPYRKAYISGMNPLSFVTAFTFGELGTVLRAGAGRWMAARIVGVSLRRASRGVLFWLFLGGFVWVIGDLFQQFAAKYLGIGRGIPLSNTNQLWGLAWGALVFGELAGADMAHKLLVLGGSVIMILGALAISSAAAAGEREHPRATSPSSVSATATASTTAPSSLRKWAASSTPKSAAAGGTTQSSPRLWQSSSGSACRPACRRSR